MREHEFRVFNKNNNEMYYLLEDRWSFGPCEGVRAVSWEDVFAERHEGLIPLQYTGLKDKNGTEIYEGDILSAVKYGTDIPAGSNRWEVYYNEDFLAFYWTNHEGIDEHFWQFKLGSTQYMVIGNIYEPK